MRRRGIALLACVAVGGCTTFQGAKLSPEGEYKQPTPAQLKSKPVSMRGVPFMLTRPEFVTQKDDKGVYSVAVTYVPDTDQRYSLRIAPTMLAKVGFTLNWNEEGGLSAVNGSAEEQVSPFLVAVLNAAGAVAGIKTTFASLPAKAKPVATVASSRPKPNPPLLPHANYSVCLEEKSHTGAMVCALGKAVAQKAPDGVVAADAFCTAEASKRLIQRLHYFRDLEGKDKGAPLTAPYANSSDEKLCLFVAGDGLKQAKDDLATALTDLAIAKFGSPAIGPKTAEAAKGALKDVLKGGDVDAARRLISATSRASGPLLKRELSLDDIAATDLAPLAAALNEALVAGGLKLVADASAADKKTFEIAQSSARIGRAGKAATALSKAGALEPADWLRRRLNDLDREIAEATIDALMNNPNADLSTGRVADLREQQIAAVSMSDEKALLDKIRARLTALPNINASGRLSPTAEYAALRQEAEKLDTTIAGAIERAAAAPADKAAPPEKLPPRTQWVALSCVDASKAAADWSFAEGASAPEYVIVLRKPGAAEGLIPPHGEGCPA